MPPGTTKAPRMTLWLGLLAVLLVGGPLLNLAIGRASLGGDWRTASHRAAGLAPDPAGNREAIVQVYASRAFSWRGAFADHTWLAAKAAGADHYTRYEVIGWYGGNGRSVVSISEDRAPDGLWYGATPRLIGDIRGAAAQEIIAELPRAVASYATAARIARGPARTAIRSSPIWAGNCQGSR